MVFLSVLSLKILLRNYHIFLIHVVRVCVQLHHASELEALILVHHVAASPQKGELVKIDGGH